MRISDWSSDVCSSDLCQGNGRLHRGTPDPQAAQRIRTGPSAGKVEPDRTQGSDKRSPKIFHCPDGPRQCSARTAFFDASRRNRADEAAAERSSGSLRVTARLPRPINRRSYNDQPVLIFVLLGAQILDDLLFRYTDRKST